MEKQQISRKRLILEAALACFTEIGVEATTIEMIRDRSGASVGSLYHHFGGKEKIAAALFMEAMQGHGERLQNMIESARTAEDGVRAVVYSYIDWVTENPDLARFVLYSRGYVAKSPSGIELDKRNRSHLSSILSFFRPFVERGEIIELPLECYSSLMIGPAHDYARMWFSGRAKTDIRVYREIFADAAWKAVRP